MKKGNPFIFFSFFWGRFPKYTAGKPNQGGKAFPVVNVLYEKIVSGAFIRRSLGQPGKSNLRLRGDFHKQLVFTNDPKENAVAVNTIFPEHFPKPDVPGLGQLFGSISSIIRMSTHSFLLNVTAPFEER